MNVLLDECTPRALKSRLSGHTASTVQDMGWAGLKNGALLAAADEHFDVFITTDKNLRFQQNLKKYGFAVILLPSNKVPVVLGLTHDIEAALDAIKPGEFVELPHP
ncbi:MAG TPA: DUF5615 family PIN-like protein [Pyrinomonadaceae bacterium]|nr:DUF5615 family PIN-like protein [Pyrinomonadaceae bacterium]